jgi:cytochrome c oxidase subunit 1
VRWTDHKTVGLLYGVTALGFLLVGFLLMILMRWQLAWPGQPVPSWLAAALGEANAPGGIMLPEFYNQLVAMHGSVMVFLAVVPLAAGAFANYFIPLQIGAPEMAFPRLNALSYWLYLIAGVIMVASFFVEGGAANSGWTSYAPLAVIATTGQSYWLIGIFLLGVSSALNAINVLVTIVQGRAPGVTWLTLPFFVWSQLVTALLLLLAFPALQAAAIFQLMDRVAGTSFFLPTGLVIGGVPLQGISGGGNPLLWQHLFWFLGHPEVYVLILPAMGIVAEVITAHARRPLWGYGLMVAAVLFMGGMSMVVWAHHMFLTGMSTSLGTFFQVTTFIISIPSVILVSALVLTLWGGSITFGTPMLFALAFLPMFGLGGLTGLPLGLAASDVTLHDTYYVADVESERGDARRVPHRGRVTSRALRDRRLHGSRQPGARPQGARGRRPPPGEPEAGEGDAEDGRDDVEVVAEEQQRRGPLAVVGAATRNHARAAPARRVRGG